MGRMRRWSIVILKWWGRFLQRASAYLGTLSDRCGNTALHLEALPQGTRVRVTNTKCCYSARGRAGTVGTIDHPRGRVRAGAAIEYAVVPDEPRGDRDIMLLCSSSFEVISQ